LQQATKATTTITRPSTGQRETARRKSIESATRTPVFFDPQGQCLSVGVQRTEEKISPYAKAKADALLMRFPTAFNPHPAKEYQQHPSAADLSQALTQMCSATHPTAQQKQEILNLVMDVLGNDREVLQRLGKALGLKDIPTAKVKTRAKAFLQGKAATDARERENNLNVGIVDKLIELRGVCDAMARTDNKLDRLCSLAPLQVNHVLLNFSRGRTGTDVLGLLAAVTGEVDPRDATSVDHSKKMQAVCAAEKKLSSDTAQVVHDAQYRHNGLNDSEYFGVFSLLTMVPLVPVTLSIFGATVAAQKANANIYKAKLEKTSRTPVNIPRNEKFKDRSNSVLHGHKVATGYRETNAGDLISILRQDNKRMTDPQSRRYKLG
jgi:hypothetical protein